MSFDTNSIAAPSAHDAISPIFATSTSDATVSIDTNPSITPPLLPQQQPQSLRAPPKPKRRLRIPSPTTILSPVVQQNSADNPAIALLTPPALLHNTPDTLTTVQPEDQFLLPQPATSRSGSTHSGISQAATFKQSLISTTDPNWRETLPTLYMQDPFFQQIFTLSQENNSTLSPQQRAIVKFYYFQDGCLYYTNADAEEGKIKQRLCIPLSPDNYIRRLILFEDHDALLHQSRDKTYLRISKLYAWPQMRRDISRYVNSCRQCRTLKTQQRPAHGTMSSPSIPTQRLSELHIDFLVGFQPTPEGSDSVLVAVCPLTGVLFLTPSSTKDGAIDAARSLFRNVFYLHGPPTVLHSDRDSKFVSSIFSSIMSFFNIQRKMSTSYNHNPNGSAEIAIKTVEVLLRHVLSHHPDRHFTDFLPLVAYVYNSSVKNAHGFTPYFSLFGFEPSNPSILLCDDLPPPTADQLPTNNTDKETVLEFVERQQAILREVKDAIQASQRTMEIFQNADRRDIKFSPGDFVYLDTRKQLYMFAELLAMCLK